MSKRIVFGSIVVGLLVRATVAAAATVTFDVPPGGLLPSYTEGGVTVAPVLGFHVVDIADHDGNASADLLNRPICCSTPYEFAYVGGVFSVARFDFVLNGGTHTFTSSTGAVVSPNASGTVTLPVTGWTGIVSFRWDVAGSSGATDTALMDNLQFCPGDCSDGNACTTDSCAPGDPAADGNGCIHVDNSAPCDDGAFCNGADTCGGGSCSVHAGDPCAGGSECANVCNETTDVCFIAAGTTCSDDGNGCTDDRCNGTGVCIHPNNSAPCDDGTFCNGADTCSGGSCVVHAGNLCAGGPECGNVCNEAGQTCNVTAGTACSNDGNVCTDDRCDGGGACTHQNNAAPCDDGSLCTSGDVCSGGSCNGAAVSCDDGNQCTIDACDAGTGCQHDAATMNGEACNDADSCTATDVCSNGVCAGIPGGQNCDDGNPCTQDICNPLGGCSHDPAPRDGFVCDDDNTCTSPDVCQGGICQGTLAEADTDGDGYCDRVENQAHCSPTDAGEIPPRPSAFSGRPGKGTGEVLLTYAAPSVSYVLKASDPTCAQNGTCGPIGFCTAGRVDDPCDTNPDCNLAANTCRMVVNYGNVPDLGLIYAKIGRSILTPSFLPAHPGCSRKVDISLDPARPTSKLKLKAQGTVNGVRKRDGDSTRYR